MLIYYVNSFFDNACEILDVILSIFSLISFSLLSLQIFYVLKNVTLCLLATQCFKLTLDVPVLTVKVIVKCHQKDFV